MISETKIEVRYAETDKMGIVHHSVFPIWYELARTHLIKKIGMTYTQMEEQGAMTPLISMSSKFISPAYYEDLLIVKARVGKLTPVRILFEYEIYRQGEEKAINTGTTEHAFVGKEFKIINLKKEKPELYRLIEESME